jgi:hypothetical protein
MSQNEEIYRTSLADLSTSGVLDLNEEGTPGRFRFIDCHAFIDEHVISVIETSELSTVSYAPVSYPWYGVPPSHTEHLHSFTVPLSPEATPGDAISIETLRTACLAALNSKIGAKYLWIDRICILQKNDQDKKWQISQMGSIYSRCKGVVVFLGGLRRLVGLLEETSWIQRGWTLQEGMHKTTYCVVHWVHGSCEITGLTTGRFIELERRHSVMVKLEQLLQAASVGSFHVRSSEHDIKVFGIDKAFDPSTNPPHFTRQFQPDRDPINALMGAKNLSDIDMRDNAIWRSALMRTSSRPVDMVFSIMSLFGVRLDPRKYGPNDREQATIDLADHILRSGRGASWLLASLGDRCLPNMVSMPDFPVTTVSGDAYYSDGRRRIKPANEIGSELIWSLTPAPRGEMSPPGSGCLILEAKTMMVKLSSPISSEEPGIGGFTHVAKIQLAGGPQRGKVDVADVSKSYSPCTWAQWQGFSGGGACLAVVLGRIEHWNLPATSARNYWRATALMLLSTRDGILVKSGMAVVNSGFTEQWPVSKIAIGGS